MIPSPHSMTIHSSPSAAIVESPTQVIATFPTGPKISLHLAEAYAELFIQALCLQERFEDAGGQHFDDSAEFRHEPHTTH